MRDFLPYHYTFMRDFLPNHYTFMRNFSPFHYIFMRNFPNNGAVKATDTKAVARARRLMQPLFIFRFITIV